MSTFYINKIISCIVDFVVWKLKHFIILFDFRCFVNENWSRPHSEEHDGKVHTQKQADWDISEKNVLFLNEILESLKNYKLCDIKKD